ncbi:hypothetical protein VTO73DRAFT_9906 [Trametes versicolor]
MPAYYPRHTSTAPPDHPFSHIQDFPEFADYLAHTPHEVNLGMALAHMRGILRRHQTGSSSDPLFERFFQIRLEHRRPGWASLFMHTYSRHTRQNDYDRALSISSALRDQISHRQAEHDALPESERDDAAHLLRQQHRMQDYQDAQRHSQRSLTLLQNAEQTGQYRAWGSEQLPSAEDADRTVLTDTLPAPPPPDHSTTPPATPMHESHSPEPMPTIPVITAYSPGLSYASEPPPAQSPSSARSLAPLDASTSRDRCEFGGIRANGEIANRGGHVIAIFDGYGLRFVHRTGIDWSELVEVVENVVQNWLANPPTAIDREQLANHSRHKSTLVLASSTIPPAFKQHISQDLISRLDSLPSSLRILSPTPEPPRWPPPRQNNAFILVPSLPPTYPSSLSRSTSSPPTSSPSHPANSHLAVAHPSPTPSSTLASVRTPLEGPSHAHSPVAPRRTAHHRLTLSSLRALDSPPQRSSTRSADDPTCSFTTQTRPTSAVPPSRVSHSPHDGTPTVDNPTNTRSVQSTSRLPPTTPPSSSLPSEQILPDVTVSLGSDNDPPRTVLAALASFAEVSALLFFFMIQHTTLQDQLNVLLSGHPSATPDHLAQVTHLQNQLAEVGDNLRNLNERLARLQAHHRLLSEAPPRSSESGPSSKPS